MHDCINDSSSAELFMPTVKATNGTRSCINYLFISNSIRNNYSTAESLFLNSRWSDHAMLTVEYEIAAPRQGKGLWRANPFLVSIPSYVRKINDGIQDYADKHFTSGKRSPQDHWDQLKKLMAKLTKNYCRFRNSWRNNRLKQLQQTRNTLYREYFSTELLEPLVEPIEKEIGSLQTEIAQIAILKAGKRWLENNEKSAGYLKRTAPIKKTECISVSKLILRFLERNTALER